MNDGPADARKLVFISYGRADGMAFAQRLAKDLEDKGGCRVWLDLRSIEKGAPFEIEIERGIHQSSIVAAVMTRRSLAEDSVCRDEVVYALNAGKRIVPLRTDADPQLRPSLLLARRNWIDFSADYQAGLDSLLKMLQGDESSLLPPRFPTITGVAPLDFGIEIAKFTRDFTGREWLTPRIDHWLAALEQRALVVVGEPGIGKSSIAAWLCGRSDVAAIHFCTQQNSRTRDPYVFVASLVGQLNSQLPEYGALVDSLAPAVRRASATDAFRELILDPVHRLSVPDCPKLVVVDSLDESMAASGETILDVLASQLGDLPPWLRIVTTTRPEPPVLARIRHLNLYELRAASDENRQDLATFVNKSVAALGGALPAEQGSAASQKITALADGNFLYARLALEAVRDGTLSVGDLNCLSSGLSVFYRECFSRKLPDLARYAACEQPLLAALAVARGPLPFELLTQIANQPATVVHQSLLHLRSLLRTFGEGSRAAYALFHKSLQDWLLDRDQAAEYWCDPAAAHQSLARALLDQWRERGERTTWDYLWSALAFHLFHAGDVEALAGAVNEHFLSAKLRRWGYAVLDDVELLARALLEVDDPDCVERCVALVDHLRTVVGGDVIRETSLSLRSTAGKSARGAQALIEPQLPPVAGLDLWAGMIPRGEVGADFVEAVAVGDRVLLMIGDAPGSGLKSAFVARFVASLASRLALDGGLDHPGRLLTALAARLSRHDYFQPMSLQLALVDAGEGIITLASAGHPFPVHRSAARQRIVTPRINGELLNSGLSPDGEVPKFEQKPVEFDPGDLLLLYTDGLTEAQVAGKSAYGNRFLEALERTAEASACEIGLAILSDWQSHTRAGAFGDDATVIVVRRALTTARPFSP